MHLYVMRGLPWEPRALIADDSLKELKQKVVAIREDAIAGGDSDADSDLPVPPVEVINEMVPLTPKPKALAEPPPSAVLAGIPPAVLDQVPQTPIVTEMSTTPSPQPDPQAASSDSRGFKRDASPLEESDSQEHKRYMLPSFAEASQESPNKQDQTGQVLRMVQVNGEVLPDGDELGDGWEYYLPSDEEFDQFEQYNFLGETPPELSPEDLAALELKGDHEEIANLMKAEVLTPVSADETIGKAFMSTRYVRDWRWRDGQWKRRSRFVSREFKWLEPWRDEFYSPASSVACAKILSSICLQKGWSMWSIDVKNAYLLVPQPTEVYVEPPGIWLEQNPGMKWRLNRLLPGQRVAAQEWWKFAVSTFKQHGFEVCQACPCLLRHAHGLLSMHVDDLQFVGPKKEGTAIVEALQQAFTMDVQGPFHEPGDTCQFLKKYFHFNEAGIAIRPNEKHFLALEKLLKLSSFGKKLKGPVHPDLCKEDRTDLLESSKAETYRKAVGIILYISSDRPDIQYCTKLLAAYMSKPTDLAWKGLLRCGQYLIQTMGYAVQLKSNPPGTTWLGAVGGYEEYVEGNPTILECYTDADWAGHVNRKSTSAGVILLDGNAIYSWSRTQRTPALSSGESEFMALVAGAGESLYVRACLEFLLRDKVQIQLRSDSVAGRGIAKRQGLGRVRHLGVQQKLAEKCFRLGPVASMVNIGDLGTKSLQVNRLSFLLGLLGMVDCHEDFSLVGRDELERQQHDQHFREKFKVLSKFSGTVSRMSKACPQGTQHS